MGRTHPLALRLKTLLNWPSNVRHPFLQKYIKHIFQNHLMSEPGIRSSTTGIWINITLLEQPTSYSCSTHPLVKDPVIDLTKYGFKPDIAGRMETRTRNLIKGAPKDNQVRKHHYYSRLVNEDVPGNFIEALGGESDLSRALQIYQQTPIHLKINVIKNPIQNAQILAQFVANELAMDVGLNRIHKKLLENLSV